MFSKFLPRALGDVNSILNQARFDGDGCLSVVVGQW